MNIIDGTTKRRAAPTLGERLAEIVPECSTAEAATVQWTSPTETGGFGSLPPDTDAGVDIGD